MSASMSNLQDRLRSHNIKPSFQRLKILEYLYNRMSHPSVDEIFQALSKTIPTLSRTTVYNTLTLFIKERLIQSLAISENELRYDIIEKAHAHFLCRVCGKIYDVDLKDIQHAHFPAGKTPDSWLCPLCDIEQNKTLLGHQAEIIETNIKGICKNCVKS